MKELVVLLEEPSVRQMLEAIVPKVAPNVPLRCIVFQGKQDLEKNITKKMKCYQNPNARFLVVRDQDSGNCETVKQGIVQRCNESGKDSYKVRIMCHELETVYLADLQAVEHGLKLKNVASLQEKNPYRHPDVLANPKQKLKLLAVQHKGLYQDIAGSRAIAPFLDINNTRSLCFKNLVSAIRELTN